MADEDKEKAEKVAAAKKRVGIPPGVWSACEDVGQAATRRRTLPTALPCRYMLFPKLKADLVRLVRSTEEASEEAMARAMARCVKPTHRSQQHHHLELDVSKNAVCNGTFSIFFSGAMQQGFLANIPFAWACRLYISKKFPLC